MNHEMPAKTRPPWKLPVALLIAPIAYGPIKPPRFPTELMKAIPAAAEKPIKNSFGRDQMGLQAHWIPDTTRHHRATDKKTDLVEIVLNAMNEIPPMINGMAA